MRPAILDAPGATILEGPRREGSELVWMLRQADQSVVVVAMLVPELASDDAIRRRWVHDVERVRQLKVPGVLGIVQTGSIPAPDGAGPPWRVRAHRPEAETLETWLSRRAPLPVDEACTVVAALAAIVHQIHAAGAVLRDLHPRKILIAADGSLWLADIGLSRVDVLSSRTAASLVLEGSAYAAPEQFTHTIIDGRSDVYGLGVLLYRALTGTMPYGDTPAILRPASSPPSARTLRSAVDAPLDAFVARCLAHDPQHRPATAAAVARVLSGDWGGADGLLVASVPCQSCGRALRPGQRLCIHCGRQAVVFVAAPPGTTQTFDVVLTKINEEAATRRALHEELALVGEGAPPALNLLVGDPRMYSKAEQQRLLRLPLLLFRGLHHDTATALQQRLDAISGLSVRVRDTGLDGVPKRGKATLGIAAGVVTAAILVGATVAGETALLLALPVLAVAMVLGVLIARARRKKTQRAPLMALRSTPAALEASDPWVARLAALLGEDSPSDVRDQVGALALAVQRLVDHRAENAGSAEAIDAATAPVERLVTLVEAQVRGLVEIDKELATLDEDTIVRALGAARARGEDSPHDRDTLLAALDRLRTLEEARAASFHRLLEAGALILRASEIGTGLRDEERQHDREVAHALALLSGESPTGQ